MHSFPEIRFFDNGGPNLHTHNYMRIHKTTFFDHENICVDTICKMIYCIVAKILKKIDISVMAALICIFSLLLKVVQRTTKLNFFRDPMGL